MIGLSNFVPLALQESPNRAGPAMPAQAKNRFGGRSNLRPAPGQLVRRFALGPMGIDQANKETIALLAIPTKEDKLKYLLP